MLHRDEIVHAHSLADPDEPITKLRAADFLLEVMGREERCRTLADAAVVLQTVLHSLLNADRYLEAAALCWGQHLFDPRPLSVRRVWHAITHFTRVLIMGAGSMGKTYTVMAHDLLDWVRDPWYTTIKIISTTAGHARAQTMSILVRFHRQSLVPLPGYIRQGYIGMDKDDRRSAISEVAIDKGSEIEGKSGKLQGFHPLPRPKEHPVFGRVSRVRARLDEAEDVPPPVWPGLTNMMLTESSDDMNVAVAGMFNPKRRDSAVALRAEPVGGWRHFDLATSKEWESAKGFHVVRLDGADCENVVQKKKVFEGLLTYEAYQELEDQPNNPDYYCADTETEVLSRRGWLTHDQLRIGDIIYTLNPKTGLAEWQAVKEVFAKEFAGDLTSLEGRSLSALITPNHRWAVTNKHRLKTSGRVVFKETSDLAGHDLIPLCRDGTDSQSEYSKEFAALIGWVVTEGTFRPVGNGQRVVIYQSNKANPSKCSKIRKRLRFLEANHSEYESKAGVVFFRFSGSLARKVRAVVTPAKVLTLDFIEALDADGRRALLNALIDGDGGVQGSRTRYICTKNKEQAGVFAALMARLGSASTTHERDMVTAFGSRRMYYVNERRSLHARMKYLRQSNMPYRGIVWCPRTDNQTFFARRHGHTYFTGNTFARGAYPISSAAFNIVSPKSLDDSRGTFIWKRAPRPCGSLDSAFEEGGDNAIYTAAQYGEAIAFLPEAGKRPIKFRQSRWCIQYDQQFLIEKQNTLLMARDVMDLSRRLGITAEWFIMDRTGNATGLHDALKLNWGNVLGVNWGEGATEVPILEEDTEKAIDQFDDVITEMFVTMGRWSEFGYIAFSPAMVTGPLFAQLSGRQYKRISKTKIRIESKKVYKKRLSTESPDEADSAIMVPHLIRMRATRDQIHAMEPEKHIVHDQANYFEAGALHHVGPETSFDTMERVTIDE